MTDTCIKKPGATEAPPINGNSATCPGHDGTGADDTDGLAYFLPKDIARLFGPSSLDEVACRETALRLLHPDGAACPECWLKIDDEPASGFRRGRRCVCGRCGRWFTARTGTILQGTHLDDRQIILLAVLIDLMDNGITPARIAEIVGVSVDTVRDWQKRFRVFDDK